MIYLKIKLNGKVEWKSKDIKDRAKWLVEEFLKDFDSLLE